MSQHYIDPNSIEIQFTPLPRATKRRKAFLDEHGQIEPLLVHNINGHFKVAGNMAQIETLLCLRELDWSTVLVEDSWTEDDL